MFCCSDVSRVPPAWAMMGDGLRELVARSAKVRVTLEPRWFLEIRGRLIAMSLDTDPTQCYMY